jgi:hypothetical protein
MFNIAVDWLDEDRSRARFALPGRGAWTAEHRPDAGPRYATQLERKKISGYFAQQEAEWQKNREPGPPL